jgi:hypothetical protein
VWVIAREQNVKQYPDFCNGTNVCWGEFSGETLLWSDHPDRRATILYGSRETVIAQCAVGSPVFRCFPGGEGRGLIFSNVERSGPWLIERTDSGFVTKSLTPEILTALNARPGERFLGEVGGKRFYWSKLRRTSLVVRERDGKSAGDWTVPRLFEPDGVVRSVANPKGIAVVGQFRSRAIIKWAGQYDDMIVDIEGYR